MNQLCRHILPAGRHCTQPAVRPTLYCRHHQVIKRALAKVEPKPDPYGIYTPLPFVFPEDRAALQINFMLVAQALNDRSINLLVRRVILTPEGEEIAPPREVLEEGEPEPTHGKECPCQVCAQDYRGAPPEEHHQDCKCETCEETTEPQPATSAQDKSDQDKSDQDKIDLSSRPKQSEVEGPAIDLSSRPKRSEVEGPAVPQPATTPRSEESAVSVSDVIPSEATAESTGEGDLHFTKAGANGK